MGIFNIKKDINQLKQTGKIIKETGKKIEQKSPAVASISKSLFVIIKWLIIFAIIFFVFVYAYYFFIERPKEQQAKEERQQEIAKIKFCEEQCNYSGCSLALPINYAECKRKYAGNYDCYLECLNTLTK